MRTLRHATRALRRAPALAFVAVLSLALGVGANAGVYSLVRQVLLRPLPVPEAERLVNVTSPGPKAGMTSTNTAGAYEAIFSYPMFRDLERAAPRAGLAGLAAHRPFDVNLAFGGRARSGQGILVSGGYFTTLRLAPALGRLLGPADDRTPGAHPVAVLAHSYWSARLGADSGVVGRPLVVNGVTLTVVGVAPRGFTGTTAANAADVFVPITMRERLTQSEGLLADRRAYWVYLFGRLAPGATPDGVRRALDAVYRPVRRDVEAPLQDDQSARGLAEFNAGHVAVTADPRGQSQVYAIARLPLTLLAATAGLVLLIACANVASLLLARGAGRAGEMAVRLSLGAGRRRLAALLLAEAGVLAAAGGAAGLAVARATMAGVASVLPDFAAETFRPALDWPAVAFAAAAAGASVLLAGVAPALQSTRPDLIARVRAGAGQVVGGGRGAGRVRTGLVGAQVALSMALLVTAALFARSLANLGRADAGVPLGRLVTFRLSPVRSGYTPERAQALFDRLAADLGAAPGVAGVAVAQVPMLANSNESNDVRVDAGPGRRPAAGNVRLNRVSAGYFRALGVPLRAGREFAEADRGPGPGVAVVNEAFARRFGVGRAAVGRAMAMSTAGPLDVTIVGVVPDVPYSDLRETPAPPVLYIPLRHEGYAGEAAFYVRAAGAPEPLLAAAAAAVRRLDPTLPVERLRLMPEQVRENTFLDRLVGRLAGAFAVLATALAAVGLYGVLAYAVAQRTRELGVRMALGASRRAVAGLVLGQVGRIVLAGGAAGLVGALALGRAARSLLFGLEGHDPLALAGAAVVLGAVGLAAGAVPARRAARTDPMRALRYE